MKRLGWLAAVIVLLAGVIGYTAWDNQRIVVRRQEIVIDGLPENFDGYTILQISDLHGRVFGEGQSRLLAAIASVEHDMIAFTGDMNASMGTDDWLDSAPIRALIEGLEGQPMLWVDGNAGPFLMETSYFIPTGRLINEGEAFAAMGLRMLTEPFAVTRGEDQIYFTPKLCRSDLEALDEIDLWHMPWFLAWDEARQKAAKDWQERLIRWYERLEGADEVLIAIDHYPEQRYLADLTWEAEGHLDYDLMICGHNHGGQIRLPFIGALYVPTITSERGCFFPNQKDVMGLTEVCGIPQYISAGLGASSSFGMLGFRFLCPPEINAITLRCPK